MAGEESEAEDGGAVGSVRSSTVLMGDLEELRQKVERFQTRRALSEFPEVQAKSEAVVSCYKYVPVVSRVSVPQNVDVNYRSHPTTSLDCWREVHEFKNAVASVEQVSTLAHILTIVSC